MIINSLKTDRIKYFKLGRKGDRRQLQNYFLTKVKGTDFLFLREEDEILFPRDLSRLDSRLDKVDVAELKIVSFFGDFYHRIPDPYSPFKEKVIRNLAGIGWVDWYDQVDLVGKGKFRDRGKLLRLDIPIYKYKQVAPKGKILKDRVRLARERNWYHRSVKPIPDWKVVDPLEWAKIPEPFNFSSQILPGLTFQGLNSFQSTDHP